MACNDEDCVEMEWAKRKGRVFDPADRAAPKPSPHPYPRNADKDAEFTLYIRGNLKKGNFVVPALPALRPSAERSARCTRLFTAGSETRPFRVFM